MGFSLLLSVILVFGILGAVVFNVAKKLSNEMLMSAIHNLSKSLDLVQGTVEAILSKEAEFQKLIAQELAGLEDPEEFIRSYDQNQTMVKVSLVLPGEEEGFSNTGEVFYPKELDFSNGNTVEGLPISQSYINSMGTWAYTIQCPITTEQGDIGTLYIEYVYDSFEESLPNGLYNNDGMLYLMDAANNHRFVLKPKGLGERNAGHLNLEDFYRANKILEERIQGEVATIIDQGRILCFTMIFGGKIL